MEALIQLAVDYGIGLPVIVGVAALYLTFKRVFKILDAIDKRLQGTFTKEETREYVHLKLEPTNHMIEMWEKAMDKMASAIDKLDETMNDIKQELAKKPDR